MKGDTHSGDSVRGTWDKAGTLRRARGAVSEKETYFIFILIDHQICKERYTEWHFYVGG